MTTALTIVCRRCGHTESFPGDLPTSIEEADKSPNWTWEDDFRVCSVECKTDEKP